MKYKVVYAVIVSFLLTLTSCTDYLDKESYTIITPENVWKEPKLIQAVLVNLYSSLETEGFDYWYNEAWRLQNPTSMSDEAQGSFQKAPLFDNGNATYTYEDELFGLSWSSRYNAIRNCNNFLTQLSEATSLSENEKKALIAEGRFLRAFNYFTLVKRYGGVPLITEAQKYDPSKVDSLQVSRDKEVDVYDFIVNECLAAAEDLPKTRDNNNKYRVTSGAAYALASRAALYAGSIARYGSVQLDGVVGIPSSEADRFFKASYESSKKIIESGVYKLYNKDDDKAVNFCNIFTKTTNGDNDEYIFQKQYDVASGNGHSWDKRNAPFSYRGGGWGCGMAPTLELVEQFEYIDGSDGKLQLNDSLGNPRRFSNPYELFKGKDPRLFASVYLPWSPCEGSNVEWMRGVIAPDGTRYQATVQPSGTNTVVINGTTYSTSGKDGGADAGDASKTGFYQKKFFDETLTDMSMGKSETPWPIFRLGEIYLNLAEAALELGKASEALEAINIIRERAGIADLATIDMDKVRHERRVELAFEGHRFWDMKRWRIADKDVSEGGLNGFRGTALYPWYNLSDGKFTFERNSNTPKQVRIFLPKNYYTKISTSDINSNPKLVQNPGYTN
jgi:hypothetical protein